MVAGCTLQEMPLIQLDTQEVEKELVTCTLPGSWLVNIVKATLL